MAEDLEPGNGLRRYRPAPVESDVSVAFFADAGGEHALAPGVCRVLREPARAWNVAPASCQRAKPNAPAEPATGLYPTTSFSRTSSPTEISTRSPGVNVNSSSGTRLVPVIRKAPVGKESSLPR
jgi:hypothetical protein